MHGMNKRVLDWIRFESDGECETVGCCNDDAKWTDAGQYCLPCYKKLPKCAVRGCHKPRAKLQKGDAPVCRDHFVDCNDGPQMDAQRQAWRRFSPTCMR